MGGDAKVYDFSYYVKSGFAGGVCCSITHGAMCPVDVVKTRIQLEPQVYNKGRRNRAGEIGVGSRLLFITPIPCSQKAVVQQLLQKSKHDIRYDRRFPTSHHE